MAGTSGFRRSESRTAMSVPVELYSFDNATFEITNTINVSQHGARVASKTGWAPNQRVSIRALDGRMISHARIVYCQQSPGQAFVIGIQLQQPAGVWPAELRAMRASNGK